jgi:tRNA(Ile2) C34 agmatinyltransferase TiaS
VAQLTDPKMPLVDGVTFLPEQKNALIGVRCNGVRVSSGVTTQAQRLPPGMTTKLSTPEAVTQPESRAAVRVKRLVRRRRKCKVCGGKTHPLGMTEFGVCQACANWIEDKLDTQWRKALPAQIEEDGDEI